MDHTEYIRNRRQQRRQHFIDLLGGKCQNCGSIDNLQFDHINPKQKQHALALIFDHNQAKIETEAKKCQLLCFNCHQAKTRDNWEYSQPPAKHGTPWKYRLGCRCRKCKAAR